MASDHITSTRFKLIAAAIILLALGLRIAGARGDLWLDEITSLNLAGAAHSIAGVFLLAYDNNHYLNTAYLHLVGPDASPLAMRAFSILLGVATVGAAGVFFLPKDRGIALLAMAVFTLSFPMVNYGSEARGYAGLILCTVVGIYAIDRERKITLALAIGFGLLFHLSMAAAAVALGLASLLYYWQQIKRPTAAIKKTASLFLPSLCAILPVALIIAEAIRRSNGYHFGSLVVFSAAGCLNGYGGMIDALIGLPDGDKPIIGLVLALAVPTLYFIWQTPNTARSLIYLALILALPAAVFLFQVPNSANRRYYLCSGTAFLLCLIELTVAVWTKGKIGRWIVIVTGVLFFTLQIYDEVQFLPVMRGQYGYIVKLMTAQGPATYTDHENEFPTRVELNFYAQKQHVSLTYIPQEDSCIRVPQFLALETPLAEPLLPSIQQWGTAGCTYQFGYARTFEGWGISGARLILYKRL